MSHPLRIRRPTAVSPLGGAVLVARRSRWGNPFRVDEYVDAEEAVRLYAEWLPTQPHLMAQLPDLRDRLLACYCKLDEPCHGDVLARLANPPEAVE